MKLVGWILFSAFICYVSFSMGTELGVFIFISIALGILIRCFTLLLDIKTRLAQITKDPDPVRDAYEDYLTEKFKKVDKEV
ncbi:hypothetical protein AB685_03415 [Bacillus sp. LL01]|uniref:hypothetical protein n=1 Tax=Bacillus sp. LL01 TaxID=1665556 RepID=UPI00064D0B75|nr:hypothetical protein [Bacillus sp. LL01]KMJ59913.1 hypothetical protein AB685_03415 [Bacillus sp. LL01]